MQKKIFKITTRLRELLDKLNLMEIYDTLVMFQVYYQEDLNIGIIELLDNLDNIKYNKKINRIFKQK